MTPYMIPISALPFAIGCVCFVILISRLCTLQQRVNTRIANSFLVVFLGVFALQQLDEFLVLSKLLQNPPPLYIGLQMASHLLIGPCVYLYVTLMTTAQFNSDQLSKINRFHFAPAGLLFILILIVSLSWPAQLGALEVLLITAYVISLIVYPWLAIIRLKASLGRNLNIFANLEKHDLSFARYWLLLLVSLALYVLCLEPMLNWFNPEYESYFNANLWIAAAGFMLCLKNDFCAQALTDHSDPLLVEYSLAAAEKPADEPQGDAPNCSIILEQLNRLMSERQLFLNNQLSLGDLAQASGFSLHQVSAALNADKDSCFYDYINALRVAVAAKLLVAHPSKAVLDIAMDAGFNSKSAFYSAFKKHLQTTPSAYRERQLKLKFRDANKG